MIVAERHDDYVGVLQYALQILYFVLWVCSITHLTLLSAVACIPAASISSICRRMLDTLCHMSIC